MIGLWGDSVYVINNIRMKLNLASRCESDLTKEQFIFEITDRNPTFRCCRHVMGILECDMLIGGMQVFVSVMLCEVM